MRMLLFIIYAALVSCTVRAQTGVTINYFNPDWSPDGKKIVFESGPNEALSIYTIDIDGKNLTRLTGDESNDEWPVWSPDGARIAFFTNRRKNRDDLKYNFQLYMMNADGTEQKRVTSDGPGINFNISWSPNGNRLAFQSSPEFNPGVFSIYTIGIDGKRRKRITDGQYNDTYPRWSPDGNQILFLQSPALHKFYRDRTSEESRLAGTSTEVMLLNLEDGARTPVTQNNLQETDPTWSADGTEVYYLRFAADGSKIFFRQKLGEPNAIAMADGDLVSNDRLPFTTRVSPDRRHLAYHKKADGAPGEFAQGIYIYDLERKQERLRVGWASE